MALTVTTAKGREAMASQLAQLARDLGAEVEIERQPFGDMSPRCTMVRIRAARGLCLNVDLDGDSGQQRSGVHVLSWHFDSASDACLANSFGGDVNPHHWRKATYIAEGFDGPGGLLGMVELGLCKARDGDAFSAEREAASIAKNGTAAARAARFEAYRAEMQGSASV